MNMKITIKSSNIYYRTSLAVICFHFQKQGKRFTFLNKWALNVFEEKQIRLKNLVYVPKDL